MLVWNFLEVLIIDVLTFLLFSAIYRLNMSPLVDIIVNQT